MNPVPPPPPAGQVMLPGFRPSRAQRGGRGSGSRGRGGTRGGGGRVAPPAPRRANSREQRVARERQRREEDANVAPNPDAVEEMEGYVDPIYERIARLGRLRLGELRADTDNDNSNNATRVADSVVDGVFDRIARMQQQEDTMWRRRP